MTHIPVLLDEVLRTLGDAAGKNIVDCTFGAGGYSRAFLERGANVVAFDRDPSVAAAADAQAKEYGRARFRFINAPFSEIGALDGKYDAVVFDLGVSSMQIDRAKRGFSFRFDGPLDMRMAQIADSKEQRANKDITAAEIIANSSVQELTRILRDYGDMKKAAPIARAIKSAAPRTTFQLRDLIHNPKDVAPVFQALRIAVNDELGEIERAMAAAPDLLAPGGKCICITFHSLEDRLVKNIFREWTAAPGDPRLPAVGAAPFRMLKAAAPSAAEVAANPRARSAHLRAAEKIGTKTC